jgi:hypothetical protein
MVCIEAPTVDAPGARAEASSRSPLTSTLSLTVGGAFVARQREMEVLRAALEDALVGRGRLVMGARAAPEADQGQAPLPAR